MRAVYTALSISLVVSLGAAAIAAALDPVARERQADMKSMSVAAKSISEFFAGKTPYDSSEFKTQAHVIAELGGERLIGHFSSVTHAEGSAAREEIGVERAKFAKLARDLAVYAAQVEAAASDGYTLPVSMRMRPTEMTEGGPFARKQAEKPDVGPYTAEHAFHMMLQTCTSCHAAFRVKSP
jgi:cytochrome c556